MKWSIVILIGVFFVIGCQNDKDLDCFESIQPKRNTDLVSIKQGIWGDIWYWEGDFMPFCPSGTISPIQKTIYVFEAANRLEVERDDRGGFYLAISTELIDSVHSDENGFFQIELDTGGYSLFIKEEGKYYATMSNSIGISGVIVKKGEVSDFLFNITHSSTQ